MIVRGSRTPLRSVGLVDARLFVCSLSVRVVQMWSIICDRLNVVTQKKWKQASVDGFEVHFASSTVHFHVSIQERSCRQRCDERQLCRENATANQLRKLGGRCGP